MEPVGHFCEVCIITTGDELNSTRVCGLLNCCIHGAYIATYAWQDVPREYFGIGINLLGRVKHGCNFSFWRRQISVVGTYPQYESFW
ncbi:hypothetical protein MT325_m643L [Paramecium bursaria chlorella virus MT325]|uniref:Uncharacterized protein m643L n=1 Tax=Paramecium bursaria Chlorella virus MT325 TaxID=346932 RepID=A7IV23_PBCVM|nr:hypothetical protein MT325_m643L [Paramecium bursaria chlorella virus MT325]